MILGFGLDKLGLAQVGEEATRALLYTFLFVAMPALVSIAYNVAMRCVQSGATTRILNVSAASDFSWPGALGPMICAAGR
jgi:hypothetical protein